MNDPPFVSDGGNIADINLERARRRQSQRQDDDGSNGNGGGEPPDNMKVRIEALEAGHKAILAKLDAIATSIADGRLDNEKRFGGINVSLAKLEERLDKTADAASLARGYGDLNAKIEKVDGRLGSIPTTWQTIAIIAGMLVGIAGLALTLSKFAGH